MAGEAVKEAVIEGIDAAIGVAIDAAAYSSETSRLTRVASISPSTITAP